MTPAPVGMLADLRRARASENLEHLDDMLARWRLCPLTGGRNNHVYAWTDPSGTPSCVKVYYKIDERRRADREWAALTLLAEHGTDNIPQPLWIDHGAGEPAIGMTMLDNDMPLLADPDRPVALKAMAANTRRIQAVPLTGLLADLERIDSIGHYIRRLVDVWPDQLAGQPDDPLTADMRRLLTAWHASGDRDLLADPGTPVLSRGDANLLNWMRIGASSACVDFEFSGYSTVALDAADQIEHISARDVDDEHWHELLADLGVNQTNRIQFLAAQRTCALRWLAILWKQRHTRIAEFETQLHRVRLLQSPTNPWQI